MLELDTKVFEDVAELLATSRGAFGLWIGAGAAIASSGGALPGWPDVVPVELKVGGERHPDIPLLLEIVSQEMGHFGFRRHLRENLHERLVPEKIDKEVAVAQAIIAQRASSIVSFNIEEFSAYPFVLAKGMGDLNVRTIREGVTHSVLGEHATKGGTIGFPVLFPHGVLNRGSVVLTASEYDQLAAGIALDSALHAVLGCDLVILGMSLDDSYLRQTILRHRRWLRRVWWLDREFRHKEWARVAGVQTIAVDHGLLWSGLKAAFLRNDVEDRFRKKEELIREFVDGEFGEMVSKIRDSGRLLLEQARKDATGLERAQLPYLRRYLDEAGIAGELAVDS